MLNRCAVLYALRYYGIADMSLRYIKRCHLALDLGKYAHSNLNPTCVNIIDVPRMHLDRANAQDGIY
jgi:hypothetical protein